MNRLIANAFANLNLVLFVVVVGFSVLSIFPVVLGAMDSSGPRGALAIAVMMPVLGGVFAIIMCGLVCVMVEIMKSLRQIEYYVEQEDIRANEKKRGVSAAAGNFLKATKD